MVKRVAAPITRASLLSTLPLRVGLLVAGLATTAAAGCLPSLENEAAVSALAEQQLQCSKKQLKVEEINGYPGPQYLYRATGCGKSADYHCYPGPKKPNNVCSEPPKDEEEVARRRAIFWLNCPKDQIQMKVVQDYQPNQPSSEQVWEASGCNATKRIGCRHTGTGNNPPPWPDCYGLQ